MIIAIGGKAGSGKSTVGNYLFNVYGFRQIAFADSLKLVCKNIFGLTDEQLYGEGKEKVDDYWKMTPRRILQTVGTECMRDGFDQDVWIKSVERKIKNTVPELIPNWVITDVRFSNEMKAVRGWGGVLIRIDRPTYIITDSVSNGHISESVPGNDDDWDFIIKNKGIVHACLYNDIESILDRIRGKSLDIIHSV
jgi:hypothetical protein